MCVDEGASVWWAYTRAKFSCVIRPISIAPDFVAFKEEQLLSNDAHTLLIPVLVW